MRFWHCQSHVVGVFTQKVTLSERHCISWGYVCRIAQQWFEGKGEEIFYVSEWPLGFPLPTHNFKNGDRNKALPTCLSKTVGSSCPRCHMTNLSGHRTLASPYVKWKCEKAACVQKICLKAQTFVCVWGLGPWVWLSFLLSACFFVFVFSVRIAQSRCPTKKDLM